MSQTLSVIKRDGKLVPYDITKIKLAISKAIAATGDSYDKNNFNTNPTAASKRISEYIDERLQKLGAETQTLYIEDIQDQVELFLMRKGLHLVAREYVLYRDKQAEKRKQLLKKDSTAKSWEMQLPNGDITTIDIHFITQLLSNACQNIDDIAIEKLIETASHSIYDGIKQKDILEALILSVRTKFDEDPNYSYVAANLVSQKTKEEVLESLQLDPGLLDNQTQLVKDAFKSGIDYGIQHELFNTKLRQFNLDVLADALVPERDLQLQYLGAKTLYDRYLMHKDSKRFELPQTMFMRVAMGIALNEENGDERAIEFYNLLSSFDYMSSTPTLFNSGTTRAQLSSCYLTTVPDDLSGIYNSLKDNALLSKWAGGLGNDWTNVRAMNAPIKGTNGKSQGIIPFLKLVNDTAIAVNQGGKRKGAVCSYLETWHLDFEDFLELRKNTGDERRRAHDMNSASWVPDLFIKRVLSDQNWTLFSPDSTPDLHDLTGRKFEERYTHYEKMASNGEITNARSLKAVALWQKMLRALFETSHPWITFKDPCNIRSPQQHCGVVHSSNLCTEITLNTNVDEIAVCNLGSLNLASHIVDGSLDANRLKSTIRTAIRMLDNVIDLNYYPRPQAKNSNMRHRPIGLGMMGFQDALVKMHIPYGTVEAVDFADNSMEIISYYAIESSALLAAERGTYARAIKALYGRKIFFPSTPSNY